MKKRIKNAKIYIAIIIISIIFVCLINLNNIKIILNNNQNNESIAKQEENIVKGSDYTEETNFEEFIKKDGETYNFLNKEEADSQAQLASEETTEQNQIIKYTNDLEEVQHLFGKYQLNFTGTNAIPLNYSALSNGYKKTYLGKTGLIQDRIKEGVTNEDYKSGEYLKDPFYSRLSTNSKYSWIAKYEDKLSIKSTEYETMPIATSDEKGIRDQKNTALMLKNSSGAELKATNDNSKIYKAYLVINTRDNRRRYNNCAVCYKKDKTSQEEYLNNHKGTKALEELPCILEDYPVTLIGPNQKYITTKMQTVEMRKDPETCDETMDLMGYIDITEFVKDEGYGMYYCVNVPFVYGYSYEDSIYHGHLLYDRYASWNIVVIEEDDTLPVRELNLKIGLANVRAAQNSTKEYKIEIGNNGVKSKSTSNVNGQILYSIDGVDPKTGNQNQEIKLKEITDSGEKTIDKLFSDIDNGERDSCGDKNCIPIIRCNNFQISGAVDRNGVAINYLSNLSDFLNSAKQSDGHIYMKNSRYIYPPDAEKDDENAIYYALKNKVGTDIELLDINQDNEFSAIKSFSNNLTGLSFGVETKNYTHVATTVLGIDYDVETPTYKTSIQTNIKENEIVISGESQRVSGDVEVINTTSTISIDDKFKITDNLNVKLYSEIDGVEYQDTTATYTVDGNNIKIKWGLDSNENDGVVDYKTSINNSKEKGSYIRFEITGVELKEKPTAAGIVYNNNIVVSGTMTNGTSNINVDNFASNESEIKSGEVNVHHCLRMNGIRPLKVEYQYDLIGKAYTTTVASNLPEQYKLVETSENIDGYFEADKIDVFYYYVLKNYPYTVNYLEKGSNKVIHEAKTTSNKPYSYVVSTSNEKIDIDGYNYDSADKDTLTIGTGENFINLYYTKRNNLSYTVNYLEKGTNEVLHEAKVVENKTFEDVVTSSDEIININGYNYDSADKDTLTIGTGKNVINLYYTKRSDLSYTVNYLEKQTNKIIHEAKTQGNMTLGDVITSENEKIEIDGYVYESVTPEKLTIGTEENIINIYYTKKIDLKFKVNYLEKGSSKELHESKIQENMTYDDTIISEDQVIPIEGYNYDSADKVSIKITAGENIINLYYTKRNDLNYTVNYLEKDTNKVLHTPKTQENMTFESVVTSKNEVISIDGYNYNSVNPESLTIGTGANVINIYYTKRNDLSYTVNYLEKDTDKVLHEAKVVENKTFKEVVTSSNEVIDIDGYNYNSVNPESLTITTGTNVINIYYTKRNDLSYIVNYLEKDTNKVLHTPKTQGKMTFESIVTSKNEVISIDGYNYNSVNPESLTITTGANVINIYYTKRNDLSYTVNYLEKDTNKVLHDAKVVNNKTFEEVVTSSNEVIDIDGYNYNSVNPESLTITSGTNVINIYYTKRNDLSYTVNYLEKGTDKVLHEAKVVENKTFEEVVTSSDEVIDIDGYNYNSVNPESLTIGTGTNVINIYYTKRNDLSYTVNYLEKDTNKVLHEAKVVENKKFEEVVTSSNEVIDIEGYNYNSVNPESLTITTGANVINIYYTKKNDLSYTVNYLEKDTDKVLHEAKLVENKTFEDIVTSSNEVIDIEGYNYNSVNPESLTITTGTNIINIYYTKRNDLRYTVNYLEKDTNKVLHDTKVVENKTFEEVITSSNEVIDIDGYNYNSVNPESLTITTGTNIINIYYTKKNDLSYTVNYLEKDTNKVLHTPKTQGKMTFESVVTSKNEIIDIEGYNYNSVNPESLTITTGANVINIYYTKKNDLSYTVNYLEKDTDKVLHDAKVVENKTFEEVVTSSDEVIDIDGYNYNSVNPESLTITTGENVINIYYTKRNDLSYTVNYLEKDTDKILHDAKLVENKTFEDVVTSSNEVIDIDGYNYNSVNPESLTITTGANVINIYYTKKNDLSYTVNYLEKDTDKVLHEAKVVENKTFEEVVTSSNEVISIDGYNYDSVNPESLTITTGTNVINIYYTKRNDLSYTVNYLEKDTNKVLHDAKVVNNKTFEEVVTSSNEVIDIDGYNYDSVNPESLTITTGENVINIYYTKRNDLSYTVNYLEKDTDKILHDAKLVENKTFEEVVTSSDEVIDIDGYNYNSVSPESLTIGTGANIINIYYTKRNDLSYTVNYLEKDTDKVLHDAKLVENKTFEEVVTSSDEVIDIDGYNYDSVNPESLTIGTGVNVINIYYTKRNDLSYTVNYIEKDTDKILHDAKLVENKTFEEVVTSSNEVIDIDGYNYDSVNPESLTITTGTNIINIYYTRRNDLSYTVNYLEKDTDKVLHDAKVVENKTFEEVVTSSNEVIDIEGYNYNSVNPESLTITTGANVINIYYTKRNDLSYTVNYLEKDTDKVLHDAKLVENKTFEEVVTSSNEVIDIDGYNYDSVNPESLTITTGTNIINIYYTKRNDLSYTVNYLEKDTNKVLHEAKQVENKTFEEVVISSNEVINIYGYNYDSIDPEELIIKTNNNIINIYYVKKDTAVIVKHYEEGTTNKLSETVTIQGKVFDEYKTEQATDIPEKYEFSYVEGNTTGTMTEEKVEVIYYYKVKDSKLTVRYVDKNHDTEIIQADETIGKVDDKYETQAREIEGYTLVGNSENTEGTLKVEATEVIYYYKKNTAVQVKYIDIDTNEELSQETIEGLEEDEYQTESKNFERYVLVKETDNTEGTMKKDEIIVIYYYEHQSKGVIEKHIDITTNEILENKVYTGKYGTPYTTKAKTIEGYDVVKERLPENAEGTMIEDVIEVNYYYIAKANINVEYIDRATGKSLITSDADQITIIGHEGDTYQTEEKTFEGYDLIEIVGNTEGTMIKGETTVKYIYARPTKVIVRYIDQITGENLITSNIGDDPITIIGHEGDAYQTEEKTITGYDLVKTSENTEGIMTKEDIEVTYYYIAKTKVIVNYIDRVTGESLITSDIEPITITGHEGDTYQTEEKTFAGYDLVKTSENTEGRMTKETIEVTYYYARPAKVKVNYLDIDTGKEIANSIEINGHEGDEYKTEAKEIKYYELKEEAKNKEGRMTVEVEGEIVNNLTEVNYYYKKLEFNFKLEKRIESIKVNGESREVKGEVGKVEIYKKELEKAKVEVVYKIRVINAGKIKGKADVMDIIPSGMTVKEESKGRWKIEGMTATTSTGEIEAGKYEDIEIIMTWNNAENNLGDIENIAQITKTDNDAGFDDIDEKDDADGANVIITVSTGDTTYVVILGTLLIVLSSIAMSIVIKQRN